MVNHKKSRDAIVNNVAEMHNDAAWNKKGIDASSAGNYTFAVDAFSKSIELNPHDVYSYFCRGVAYSKLGKHQHAIEDYSEAIRLKPNYADAYYNRALTYSKCDQYQLSIEDLNKVIRLKPDYADAYRYRGVVYFLQGKDNFGYRDARKAHTLGNSELLEWAKGEENAVNSEGNLKLIINSNSQFNSNIKVNGK